jgi:hypothetical protein
MPGWGLLGTRTSGLIHDEDATAAEDCACQAQQLPLTDGGVATVICSTQQCRGNHQAPVRTMQVRRTPGAIDDVAGASSRRASQPVRFASRPPRSATNPLSCTAARAACSASSGYCLKGSKLLRMVPLRSGKSSKHHKWVRNNACASPRQCNKNMPRSLDPCAPEQRWILGDDTQRRPQLLKRHIVDPLAVDANA